jgi:hypothetical protein
MEKTVNELILELKTALENQHAEKFYKFYLSKFPDGRFEALVAIKEDGQRKTGRYYRIEEGVVHEEITNL